ncbi:MAG: 3-oxo-5-alpha-steroid 4-dehydrogenase-domain-containing protein [Monoraphidium minutum]|nr:MAG: 3-oxo-5-alpha-steroid 4-dehydrogenase-domain-containing protein [Monoraphidium minutum]
MAAAVASALGVFAERAGAAPTSALAAFMALNGVAAFVALMSGIAAPYGRYSTGGWGFFIDAKLAWVTQELGSFAVPAVWLALFATPEQRGRAAAPANGLLLACFLGHYAYRALVFPLRMRGGKPTPFVVWLLAAVFTCYNGYMQAKYFLTEAPRGAAITPRVAAGVALWGVGLGVNLHSDEILRRLRRPGETGYKIPRGGAFELVSAANYTGEMLEWAGWALAAWSAPAAAFAFFVFCNLAPRGWHHHHWYKSKFPRYPKARRAVIPSLW